MSGSGSGTGWRPGATTGNSGSPTGRPGPSPPSTDRRTAHAARRPRPRPAQLPAWYAPSSVELAYATTVYGAQGDTTHRGHLVARRATSAASAYVGMTRGRHHNIAHLVAETPEQARTIWEQAVRPRPGRPRPRCCSLSGPPRTSSATAPSSRPRARRRSSPTCGVPGPGGPTSTTNISVWSTSGTPCGRSPRSTRATHRTSTDWPARRPTPSATGARRARESRTSTPHSKPRPRTSKNRCAAPGAKTWHTRDTPPRSPGTDPVGSANAAASSTPPSTSSPSSRPAGDPSCPTCPPIPPTWRRRCGGCTGVAPLLRSTRSSPTRSPVPIPTPTRFARPSAMRTPRTTMLSDRAPGSRAPCYAEPAPLSAGSTHPRRRPPTHRGRRRTGPR